MRGDSHVRVRKRLIPLVALVGMGSLFAAACGDSGSTSSSPTTTPSGPTTTVAGGTAVAGCGAGAATDPADISATRKVARCDSGAPAPKPLPQKETVTISSNFKLEFNSPLLLADSLGEYAKENIEIKWQNLKFSDAVSQLNAGAVDVAVGGFEIALFNAANNNLKVKAVMGNYYPPHAGDYSVAQTGLWCRRDSFSTPQNPNLKEAEKLKWASSVGKGSSAIYYSVEEIRNKVPDFDISKLNVQTVASTDTVAALKNKAVDCGILLDPTWLQVSTDPAYFLAATQTPGEPVGMYAYGKRLLEDRRDIGEAFARATIRTINTYFNGDYHKDQKVMDEIAKVTNQPMENLVKTDSLVMDWEIRAKTTQKMQQLFIDLGVITDYKTPVPDDKIVDRSFYLKAVGKA